MKTFQRTNTIAWRLLKDMLSKRELNVAFKLGLMAKAYTNSLQPLNDATTAVKIAEELEENRNTVMKDIDKLFKLGVIAKFEVYEKNEVHKKYWVFNPYLMFNGKDIQKDVPTLFDGTYFAQMMK